jgi:uncharacterized membrane protein
MSSKRSRSRPRSSHQEPEDTKKQKKKSNEKTILTPEQLVKVRKLNLILERDGYDIETGLKKGMTQEMFDEANAEVRKKKSEKACSEVEC